MLWGNAFAIVIVCAALAGAASFMGKSNKAQMWIFIVVFALLCMVAIAKDAVHDTHSESYYEGGN